MISEYENNPLITALPCPRTADQWFDVLERPVPYAEHERTDTPLNRSHMVHRLLRSFVPLAIHVKMALHIDTMIRQGYVHRSIPDGNMVIANADYSNSEEKYSDYEAPDDPPLYISTLIGTPWLGKTSTVRRILAAFPQRIFHNLSGHTQVVWLFTSVPKDASIKAVTASIFASLAKAVQIDFRLRKSGATAGSYLEDLVRAIETYSVGLLVIDDLHAISAKHSGGQEELMNFLSQLSNDARIPILFIGTGRARKLIQMDLSFGRRTVAMGGAVWKALGPGDEWRDLLESLWKYQWTETHVELDEKFEKLLYEQTRGIVGLVPLYLALAQLRAIASGKKKLSLSLFQEVERKDLLLIRPLINAIKSNNKALIAKYEDIVYDDLARTLASHEATIAESTQQLRARRPKGTNPLAEASLILQSHGIGEEQAEQLIRQLRPEQLSTSAAIVRSALELLNGPVEETEFDPDDLRKKR